jgi:hypothetical protein
MRSFTFAACTLALFCPVSSALAATLFSSGPVSGEISGWDITAYTEADSFTLSAGATVTGADFDVWVLNGVSMTSVSWSILSDPSGIGTTYASGTGTAVSQTFLFTDPNPASNSYGYDIDNESFSIPSFVAPATGTYWLELTGAVTNSGGAGQYAYWDENDNPNVSAWSNYSGGEYLTSGVDGCAAASCSETFAITGTAAVPEPGSFPLLAWVFLGVAIVFRRRNAGSARLAK